jgi:hypothetical protein
MSFKKNDIIISEQDVQNVLKSEFLQCPFCGSKNIYSGGIKNEETGNVVYRVFCTGKTCSATMHVCLGNESMNEDARNEVVRMWNTRFDSTKI